MLVEPRHYGPVTVLRFCAERYNSDDEAGIMAAVGPHIAEGTAILAVFDFTGVTYISSSTLRVIAQAHTRAVAGTGHVVSVGGGELVRHVIGFLPVITQFDDLGEAVRTLSPEAGRIFRREEGAPRD